MQEQSKSLQMAAFQSNLTIYLKSTMPKYEFETGEKLTFLGLIFLIFKYLIPVIVGILLILIALIAIEHLLAQLGITISSTEEGLYALIMAGLIVIVFINR